MHAVELPDGIKEHFGSLDEMFDPEKNIQYAAKFVKELYGRHQNWED